MAKQPLTEEIKLRIPPEWKLRLLAEAASEGLDLSDIGRRALAEFLSRRRRRKAAMPELKLEFT